ncbi:hypothetical protein FA13DRAFT_1235258 [Coprinellus micaceus]|uniref:Uncharacterized protein n=1 Tax=Coprinellus micaceus TaxID=71717 RepID=A0A4Y7TRL4_COPMI|nr:hypothetical protein FA13DRAFT_1235258 [Coprinellus micaceus]
MEKRQPPFVPLTLPPIDTNVEPVCFPSAGCHPNFHPGPYVLEGNNTHPRRVAMLLSRLLLTPSRIRRTMENRRAFSIKYLSTESVCAIRFRWNQRLSITPGHIMPIHDLRSPLSIGNSRLALSLGHHPEFLMTPTSHRATPDTRSFEPAGFRALYSSIHTNAQNLPCFVSSYLTVTSPRPFAPYPTHTAVHNSIHLPPFFTQPRHLSVGSSFQGTARLLGLAETKERRRGHASYHKH